MNSMAQPALTRSSFGDFLERSMPQITVMLSLLFIMVVSNSAFAAGDENCTKVTGFFSSIEGLLKIVSVSIVTIAVIFAGYQIAFAHKRISDVAPILIGGVLIGAAGQVASMLLGSTQTAGSCTNVTQLLISQFYA